MVQLSGALTAFGWFGSSEVRELTGTAGIAIPIGIFLGPRALVGVLRNKKIVTMLISGLSKAQRGAARTRFLTQLVRAVTQANIPFSIRMSDGSTTQKPARKSGSLPENPTVFE